MTHIQSDAAPSEPTGEKGASQDIKKVAKGTGATLVGTAFGKSIFFLSQILIARFLGVEEFGLYGLGLAAVKICEIFARLGLNMGGMRFVSIHKDYDPPKLKGVLISATTLSLVSGFFVGFLVFFLSEFMAGSIFQKPELAPVLQSFSFAIPFTAGTMVVSSLLQGFHTTKYTMISREIMQPALNLGLFIAFYLTGFGLLGAVYAFILSNLGALLTGIHYCRKLFPDLFRKHLPATYEIWPLVSYSVPLLFVGFLHFLLSSADILMLGYLSSARDVGIYRAAAQISSVMSVFLIATNSIYAPVAADLYQRSEMARLAGIFKTTTHWLCFGTVPIFILLLFSGREILMIFGKDYAESRATTALSILAFGHLVSCMTGGVGVTLTMTRRQKLELVNSLCMAGLNLFLNYLLIPRYGAIGAAIASSSAIVAINLLRLGQIVLLYRMHPFTREVLKYMVPAAVSVLVLFLYYEMHFPAPFLVSLIIKTSIILALFAAFFLTGQRIVKEDDIVWKRISRYFRRAGSL